MTAQLSRSQAVAHRMNNHALWSPRAGPPGELVRRFVAMQAQEYSYALWAIAQRLRGTPDAAGLAVAADRGEILRTHVLRPTWHFVTPADADWLLRLTGPRVQRINAAYLRRTSVDATTLDRAFALILAELAGGRHRTRPQLADALRAHGLDLGGLALSLVMMEAELQRLVISGASSGKQRGYALFEERVPDAGGPFERERALAELLARFIATRGPVTLKDFAVWSGLTLATRGRGWQSCASRSPADSSRWRSRASTAGGNPRQQCRSPRRLVRARFSRASISCRATTST